MAAREGSPAADDFAGAPAGIFRDDALDRGMLLEKARALRQRYRMRLHGAHLLEGCAGRTDQVVRDRQDHFRDDGEFAFEQQIVAAIDRAGQAVFDRGQHKIRRAFVDGGEHGFEGRARHEFDLLAQELDGGFFTERAALALEGHSRFRLVWSHALSSFVSAAPGAAAESAGTRCA